MVSSPILLVLPVNNYEVFLLAVGRQLSSIDKDLRTAVQVKAGVRCLLPAVALE